MGLDGIGWERKGSSFRSRRNVTAELPKDWRGLEGIGGDWIGLDGKGKALLSAVAEM
ncbi:hypothetical protein LBMAG52_36770 [Planctomycetia bacterium]|nr:hypothetical protein LBMAG52_36770 [Planctomycetia bacterium]